MLQAALSTGPAKSQAFGVDKFNKIDASLQVVSLAIIAVLTAFVATAFCKNKHHLYGERPPLQPHTEDPAESMTHHHPKQLTLTQLLKRADAAELDGMVCSASMCDMQH